MDNYKNRTKPELISEITRLEKLSDSLKIESVTDHKNTDDELIKQKDMFELVINSVPARIYWKDINSIYLGCNSAFAKAAGGGEIENIIGKNDFDFIWAMEAQKYIDDDRIVIKTGIPKLGYEEYYTITNGEKVWWNTSKIPLKDSDGKTIGILCTSEDITERKLAQLKLNQSTQLLETSQSIAKLGGWELDISTNNLFWTAETYRIHDTSPEEFNPTVEAAVDYFLPESRHIISNALKAAKEDGESYDLELETYTTKGRRIDVRTTCEVILLDGKPTKLTGIFQDITARKMADDNLKSTKDRLLFATKGANLGIWNWNILTGELIWSDKCRMLFKIPLNETMSYPRFIEALHPDDREMTNKAVNLALNNGEDFTVDYRSVWPDGSIHWLSAIGRGYFDNAGKAIRMEGVVLDITDRKQAIEKLKVSEEKFRVLYNSSPDMYVSVSPDDATILFCNDTLLKNIGYTRDELIGAPIFNLYHDECMVDVKEAFKQFSQTGKIENKELVLKRKDGSKIEVSLNVDAVKDETGKILHSMSSWRDISKQKLAEEEITKHREHLEEMVKERTKDLEDKNKKLEKFNDLFVDREFRIKELRDEIEKLSK